MSAPQKQQSILMSAKKLSGNGLSRVRLSTRQRTEGIGGIISQIPKDNVTCMLESLLKNKNKICKDKCNTYNGNIPVTWLSRTLGADLTSVGKDSGKYWNSCSKGISQKLSFLPRTGLADLEPANSSAGYSSNLAEDLSYLTTDTIKVLRKNSPRTCWKLLQFSQPDIMEEESTITRKVRIYPNKKQRDLFQNCFRQHNYFYNKTVEYINVCDSKNSLSKIKKHIRDNIVIRNKNLTEENKWMKEVPLDTREAAAFKVLDARKTCFSQLKKGLIDHFKLNFNTLFDVF